MAKQSSNARKRARKKALRQQEQKPQQEEAKHGDSNRHHHASKKRRLAPQKDDDEEDDDLLAAAAAWASAPSQKQQPTVHHKIKQKKPTVTTTSAKHIHRKPPPFPTANKNLPIPEHDFLKDEGIYRPSFQAALDTSYEGLAWDHPNVVLPESQLQQALAVLDEYGLFRTDVTQPAGLGTKLVPSYVTRCLLGEEGTTYRYLGLRMFSHPWNGGTKNSKKLQAALQTFQELNTKLTQRTQLHLQDLKQKRQAASRRTNDDAHQQEPVINGKTGFDVTLINKMTIHKRLREEPMFKGAHNKYSVGWHADSSLQHFSTIAVYQSIVTPAKKTKSTFEKGADNNQNWSVALRVTHDAEGPNGKRLGDITVEETAPPIAVELPSGSTYYMLDDFNHHHQHAVLAPPHISSSSSSSSIRYSSTHRLLRQGHNVKDILKRCHKTTSAILLTATTGIGGPKKWRSEQLLLTELENEWLRQFFIQGSDHKQLLWESYWNKPIQQLFQYWQLLETQTRQVLVLLQQAAQEQCNTNAGASDQKKKKKDGHNANAAATRVEQLSGDRTPKDALYSTMASLLLERAKSRDLWHKREVDPVFQKLPPGCRPIPFPVHFGGSTATTKNGDDDVDECLACSPLPGGSSAYLTELASAVQAWGDAYESRSANDFLHRNDLLGAVGGQEGFSSD
jgi:alpha-ketoglutarate-dependent dioxygenase FTO